MTLSLVTKTFKDGNGSTFTGYFATDGTNVWPVSVLVNESGNIITDSTGLPVSVSSLPALATGSNTIGAVNQSGTWTVQPGNTANTTAWKVDGSGVTQPVSGTVTANAGTGNFAVNHAQVSGTAVATAAAGVQKVGITGNAGASFDAAGQNAASPSNEIIVGGQFNKTPAMITSGNVSPLQLDSSGNLKVNIAAGGAAGGTSSSFNAAFPGIGTAAGLQYQSSAPTLTSGNMAAFQGDVNGNLKVNLQTPIPAGGNLIGSANIQAATSGGTSTYAAIGITGTGTGPLLTTTVTSIKASAGTLYRVRGYNPNNTLVWIQLFDLATGSVTLGTTVPKDPIPLLPNAGFDELLSGDFGAAYLTAIGAAAATTSTGNTAPSTGITATFYFK